MKIHAHAAVARAKAAIAKTKTLLAGLMRKFIEARARWVRHEVEFHRRLNAHHGINATFATKEDLQARS